MSAQTFRILLCPNAFKGSLTAAEAARAMAEGIAQSAASVETVCLPLADGGDGTLETLVEATGGEILRQTVRDPLGRPAPAAHYLAAVLGCGGGGEGSAALRGQRA